MQRPNKIIAVKGVKQLGSITSAERGVLVTMCLAVNAVGTFVPPMFIFSRKMFKSHFIRDGPPGCTGTGNGSGWMTEVEFRVFMEHFVKHVRPSKDNRVLLLLDNHESHLTASTISYAKESGIILLSFPPHCSHKLQPLDRTVYGPLKKYVSAAQESWLRSNPGKIMTIYDTPSVVREALPRAVIASSIISGFQVTGIEPYNREIFTDADFAPSLTTDRPDPATATSVPIAAVCNTEPSNLEEDRQHMVKGSVLLADDQPAAGNVAAIGEGPSSETANVLEFSFEAIRPFPKAPPRNSTSLGGRKKRKTAILTDTPEKRQLELEQDKKAAKNSKRGQKSTRGKTKAAKAKHDSSSEDDECFCLVCCERFSNSKHREKWMQCMECKNWSHEECTPGTHPYVCHNCDSD